MRARTINPGKGASCLTRIAAATQEAPPLCSSSNTYESLFPSLKDDGLPFDIKPPFTLIDYSPYI
jgi:hypothetical protein